MHYNCAQQVFLPFAREMGMDEDTAYALAAPFGGGMGMGSVCGTLTGALLALGQRGCTREQCGALVRAFREAHGGAVNCAELLKIDRDKGNTDKRAHCDRLICDTAELLERFLTENEIY